MSPIEYALLIWDSAHQRPRKKETGMCSLVVKKFEHFHVQRVQRPPVCLIIKHPQVDMNMHENPLNFFCLVTLSPSWQGMTINLNNTGSLLAEGREMHLQLLMTQSLMGLIGTGKGPLPEHEEECCGLRCSQGL